MSVNRKGDWIQTYTGKQFWPLDPRPEEVNLRDIAHALSLLCRYTGHTKSFYSVAEHSVRVYEYLDSMGCNQNILFWGLMHDAAEAYTNDISTPLKRSVRFLTGDCAGSSYESVEDKILAAVASRFNIPLPNNWSLIKSADNILLATEVRDLMVPSETEWGKWLYEIKPLPKTIEPRNPEIAELAFLAAFACIKERA